MGRSRLTLCTISKLCTLCSENPQTFPLLKTELRHTGRQRGARNILRNCSTILEQV